jgi:hypothetical protein
MDKVLQWIGALLKKLLPAARRDPVAATLGVLAVFSEAFMLSNWQYWGASFSPFDSASPVLLLLFVWRQYRRSWTEASLGLAVAVLLLAILVFFSYLVPFKRLSITIAEFLVTIILVVRHHP